MGWVIGVLLFLMAFIGFKWYMYNDCKAVGHSTFYCIVRTGG
jgi:hypothetical protein